MLYRNRIISSALMLLGISVPGICQTGLGSLTHIANSTGAAATDHSPLKGEWVFVGLSGAQDRCLQTMEGAFVKSGFRPDSTAFVFWDGAAFAITGPGGVVPGTWRETGPGRVHIGFSKIFTYGVDCGFRISGGRCALSFTKEGFLGFTQRMLAILGRSDTSGLVRAVSGVDSVFVNLAYTGKKQDPQTFAPEESFELASPAINAAIDSVAANGGGTVIIPAGVHYCHSIRLKSNVCLRLESGAVLKAAPACDGLGFDVPEPAINDKYQGFGHIHVHNSLIWGTGLENVTICGEGMIDGSLLDSWTEGGPGHGNKAIGLRDCRNVTIRDITILRGGHFSIHVTAVDNLIIDGVRVDSDRDGIDIICCKGVSVSNCFVNTPEDDSIVLKSPYTMGCFRDVENVSITGCHISGYRCGTLLDGTRLRFPESYDTFRSGGRIKLGTESSGGYRNVCVSNCTFDYCGGIVLESEDGGVMEGVTFSNIVMRDPLSSPIFIRLGSRMRSPEGTPVGKIRGVSISDVRVYGAQNWTSSTITGIPGHYVEDITLRNVHISSRGGFSRKDGNLTPPEFEKDYPEPWMFGTTPSKGLFIRHAKNVLLDNVTFDFIEKDGRPLFVDTDASVVRRHCGEKAAGTP